MNWINLAIGLIGIAVQILGFVAVGYIPEQYRTNLPPPLARWLVLFAIMVFGLGLVRFVPVLGGSICISAGALLAANTRTRFERWDERYRPK